MADSLSFGTLLTGARKFARSAMEAHSEGDEEVFLLHAGVSIERLVKAALVRKSPFLLMELNGRKEDMLFHLTGVREVPRVHTVGAAQAIGRLRQMGALPPKDPELDELIELRNGVAHLTASAREGFDGLTIFCRVTNHLLNHLDSEAADYWGTWSNLVDITLSDLYERVERQVAQRMEQARYRLKDRFDSLPVSALETYAATRSYPPYGVQFHKNRPVAVYIPYPCPACDFTALVVTGPPALIMKGRPGEAQPVYLLCPVCHFFLNGPEFNAAGIASRLPLVDEQGVRLLTEEEEMLWHTHPYGLETPDDDIGDN